MQEFRVYTRSLIWVMAPAQLGGLSNSHATGTSVMPPDDPLQSLGTCAKPVPVWPIPDDNGSIRIFISQDTEWSGSVSPNYPQVFCRPGFRVIPQDTFSGSQNIKFRKGFLLFKVASQATDLVGISLKWFFELGQVSEREDSVPSVCGDSCSMLLLFSPHVC